MTTRPGDVIARVRDRMLADGRLASDVEAEHVELLELTAEAKAIADDWEDYLVWLVDGPRDSPAAARRKRRARGAWTRDLARAEASG